MRIRSANVMLLAAALACPARMAAGAGTGAAATAVSGTVVEEGTYRPLGGVRVAAGAARATTDGNGRFMLNGVPPVYELAVADRDGASITIYRGLRRRNPLVIHKPRQQDDGPARGAAARGTLSGGGPYPMTSGWAYVHLFSPEAAAQVLLNNTAAKALPGMAVQSGPDYGPLVLSWTGPESIAGTLVALRTVPAAEAASADGSAGAPRRKTVTRTPDAAFWFARREVKLTSAETLTVDLPLARARAGRVTGQVEGPPGGGYHPVTQLQVVAVFPLPRASLSIVNDGNPATSFDFAVPDLRRQGARLCVLAFSGYGSFIWSRRCGVAPGDKVSLALPGPPAFTTPSHDDEATPTTQFAWTDDAPGIHVLKLEPDGPTATAPRIYVYTAENDTTWPDTSALGVAFPSTGADYKCTVVGIGPHAATDEAAGPDGIGAPAPAATSQSYDRAIHVKVRPAPARTGNVVNPW